MTRRSIALAAGALLAATGSFAQASSSNPIPSLKFEHYRLANGMNVIFYVDRRAPVVHVNMRFYVGSKDERPGRTGFAHLFEHMMFEDADAKSNFLTLWPRSLVQPRRTEPRGSMERNITKPCLRRAWSECCGWNRTASRICR